ncbi:MAG: SusD/RagB family nutrient-binding outer membrane lipoprotein [Bacteroidota bacterium]
MKYLNILVLAVLVTFMSSCDNYFEGVNDNPNEPSEVTPDVILPGATVTLGYGIQGDMSRYTSMLMQHCTGISRQFATYQNYAITETETDNWWRFNMYAGAMMDLYVLNQQAEADQYTQYAGVAKALLAYALLITTDLYGDIPYTEAFQGANNLTPTYDTQEQVYSTVQDLLTTAKTQLAAATAVIAPGSDDLIYGGDVAAWTRFCNFLSARAYLHLGLRDAANYTNALNAIDAGAFTSAGDDAFYNWGAGATESAPWFQYIQQRDDIAYTGFIYDLMSGNGDPRYTVYLDTANSTLGSFFASATAPYYFGSYVEQKFIEAEAAFRTGDPGRAATAHNEAVMASLARYGVSDATFEMAEASYDAASITLDAIMTQKYVAMFLDTEAFTDWRRTGIPALTAVPGNVTNGVIPVRMPYPQSERLFNGGNVSIVPITTPVWWDI